MFRADRKVLRYICALFTAVLPKRLYKTHTPGIHYHLRDKSHRSQHGSVLVKLLSSSPLRPSLCFLIGVRRLLSASCFISIFLNFLGYARGKYLVLQPRFHRLPRVRQLVRHSVWSHIFSRSVFVVLFPFCLLYFLSHIHSFGCICFQFFPW